MYIESVGSICSHRRRYGLSYLLPMCSMLQGMAGYVYVCDDETNRDNGVELPIEEDGNLLISVLQSQFERASGLKYR